MNPDITEAKTCTINMQRGFSKYEGEIAQRNTKMNVYGICGRTIEIHDSQSNSLVLKWGDPEVQPVLQIKDATDLPNQLADLNQTNDHSKAHLPLSDSRFRGDIRAFEQNVKEVPVDDLVANKCQRMWFVKDPQTKDWSSVSDENSIDVKYWVEKKRKIEALVSGSAEGS